MNLINQKTMKIFKNLAVIILLVFVFVQNSTAQKSDILLQHYKNEFQTFKEFIAANKAEKGDTTIDIKFYYINIEVSLNSPYINGNVLTCFEPLISGLNQPFILI